MPMSPDLAKVQRTQGVLQSVKVYLADEKARLDAAVAEALANGATGAQLQPIRDAIQVNVTMAEEIATAIAAPGGGGPAPA